MTIDKSNAATTRAPAGRREVERGEGAKKRVLVADAHEETLIALERMLEDAGFQTATAWTATDALRLLERQKFHLLLVNEYLPDAECEELLKKTRKLWARMPSVVMLTSAPEITNTRSLTELGVREVVCKHTHARVLEAVTRSLAGDPHV